MAGSATLRAWTLPGPQYGTLLWLAPGYGLFAGWLLFAAALNLSVAISYNSYPSGTLPWPETRTEYTHRGSLWPPVLSLVIAVIAVLSRRPGDAAAHAGGHPAVHAAPEDRTWPRRSC